MKTPGALTAAALTVATQVLLVVVAWNSWRLLDDDAVRVAGKVLAVVAGAVCASAAVALFVPLAKALARTSAT